MDKLIFGLGKLVFGGKEIGYIDENGLQPAGTAPTKVDINAAQVKDGPVITLTSNPGKKAFSCNLIQLDAEALVDTIGGTKDENGNWEPPTESWEKTGVADIVCDSGHTIRLLSAKVSANDWVNGVNSSNVLGLGLTIEILKDSATGKRFKIFAPGIDPDTGAPYETV
jgi:hypothetical protein